MPVFFHDLARLGAMRYGTHLALESGMQCCTYSELWQQSLQCAALLRAHGVMRQDRVAIYLEKRVEAVTAMLATSMLGAAFVPVNPLLKHGQLQHILNDCAPRVLLTSQARLEGLSAAGWIAPPDMVCLCVDAAPFGPGAPRAQALQVHDLSDQDMVAILYTSGSTGQPKGVVLSHGNVLAGVRSVAHYLELHAQDRLLCVLPFSFDYGLNQLTTMLYVGGTAVLWNYLLPQDVVRVLATARITGLAGVPPLWASLARQVWPACPDLRFLTNSGGSLAPALRLQIQAHAPAAHWFLMYGLTEAFRSTYLPPAMLAQRPDSIGRAIPNAQILVLQEDGSPTPVGAAGELVHRGAHVALGYWRDPARTAARFRPWRAHPDLPFEERVVWSGDLVRQDEEGYLYFLGRRDEQIKTSGYRVSPEEIEAPLLALDGVHEAAAFGVAHAELGQAIVVCVYADPQWDAAALRMCCQQILPAYLCPQQIVCTQTPLPRNPNGKFDRAALRRHALDPNAETAHD